MPEQATIGYCKIDVGKYVHVYMKYVCCSNKIKDEKADPGLQPMVHMSATWDRGTNHLNEAKERDKEVILLSFSQ